MNVYYTKNFSKSFKKRFFHNKKLSQIIENRVQIFMENPKDRLLRTHALIGTKKGYYSFSVSGDIRIVYYVFKGDIFFIDIGTHNQVY